MQRAWAKPARWGLLLLLVVGLARAESGARIGAARAENRPARPNLLLLLSDDQRWDTLGCAGNPIIETPNLDALAREGVRFREAFVTTPICAASRATILTGLHERTHRFTFGTPPLSEAHVALSYPARLRRAGYRTGFIGKFGVEVPPSGAERMFDRFVPLNRTPYFKLQPDGRRRHVDEIAIDRAIEFVEEGPAGQPFCLSVSFNAPHAEDGSPQQYFWPSELDGLYRDAVFPVPKTMAPEFFERLPAFLKNTESRVRFHWRFDEPQKYQEMVRGYYRMITHIDREIGRLLEALRRRGLAENTVVLFTSDNGYFLGERGFADKWYGYEPSLRVPLIVFDPRRPVPERGRIVDAMALNVDLAPTLLDLAGAPVPREMQGRSLRPWLEGRTPRRWRTDFFFEHLFERNNIPKSEGVRTERWTYIRWFEQRPVVEELYNHRADFEEVHNLAGRPEYADVLERLRRRTDELRDRYGGPYQPAPPAAPGAPRGA